MLKVKTIAMVIALTGVAIFFIPVTVQADTLYTIDRVIDGDTIRLSNGEKVRLIGVDAPENRKNTKARNDSRETEQDIENIIKAGREAANWLEDYFKGKKVFLRYDPRVKNKRGLTMAYVYVYGEVGVFRDSLSEQFVPDFKKEWADSVPEGKFVFLNGTVVKAGYAQPAPNSSNLKHGDVIQQAYQDAKENSRGLWDMGWATGPCQKEGEKIVNCIWCFVDCCGKLDQTFDRTAKQFDSCLETPLPGATGTCSDCGNKTCESENMEDGCNCPRDCDKWI